MDHFVGNSPRYIWNHVILLRRAEIGQEKGTGMGAEDTAILLRRAKMAAVGGAAGLAVNVVLASVQKASRCW